MPADDFNTPSGRRQGVSRRRRLALGLVLAGALGAGIAAAVGGGGAALPLLPAARPSQAPDVGDPLAFAANRQADYIARATAGEAHVLYAKSPGGAFATAARVAKLRPLVDRASAGRIDPTELEAIVFLESAGFPNAIAGPDPSAAAGLTQIVASTGQALLGMHIDLAHSAALGRRIAAASGAGNRTLVVRLERERATVDDRFDPLKALAATVRYLDLAQARFGRSDLALESYHMGIGNLGSVLDLYDSGRAVPYVQLYFDTAPDHHAAAYRLLSSFGDDSWTYYWRILAAEQIMRLYRSDPSQLQRLAALQTESGSAAEVLHPPDQTQAFADPASLDRAYASAIVVRLPSNPGSLGLAYDPGIGELADRLGFRPALYRGLRPEALHLLIELAARVRTLSGSNAPLTLTSAVTDLRYQRLVGSNDPPAAAGWSFTIARHYASPSQAQAFQTMLDRLQALDVIAWERYPSEIEVTVGSEADRVLAGGA